MNICWEILYVIKEALEIMLNEGHDRMTIGSCCLQEFKTNFLLDNLLIDKDWDRFFPNLYEMTLPEGNEIVVYNLHMDASSDRDETKGNDARDREARQAQWVQLREHILDNLDERPIVVAGDMNSFYHRDDIKTIFIDAIEATGKAIVKDAWVESCHNGMYPAVGSEAIDSETLDNILYISPIGGYGLELVNFEIDEDGYKRDGKPLGDHYPLIARFSIIDKPYVYSGGTPNGINHITDGSPSSADTYDLNGIRQTGDLAPGTYIVNGRKVVKH